MMSQDTVGIIKAAAETASWARAHGCIVEIHIGHTMGRGTVDIKATPIDVKLRVDDAPTAIIAKSDVENQP